MRRIARFHGKNGGRSAVYQDEDRRTYTVWFWNSAGIHMDASDYHTRILSDAMNAAGEEHPDCIRID